MQRPAAGGLMILFAALGCSPPRTGAHDGGSLCSADARQILEVRCDGCHASNLTGAQRYGAPADVNFNNDAALLKHIDKIRETLVKKTMPPQGPLLDCETEKLMALLAELEKPACVPNCSEKECGPNGCGGVCGNCEDEDSCSSEGHCD